MDRLATMQIGISLYEALFHNPDFGMLVCEFDRETAAFIKISKSFHQILGWDIEDVEGRPFIDFIHPDDVQSTLDQVEQQLLKGKESSGFVNRYRTKKGDYIRLRWHSTGAKNPRHFGFAAIAE